MQTFLTTNIYEQGFNEPNLQAWNFTARQIASHLDNKRLHKQALEGWQILMCILEVDPDNNPRTPKGWVNHPAVKMWRGYEWALIVYVVAMCDEWKRRGYKTSIRDKVIKTSKLLPPYSTDQWLTDKTLIPDWMRNTAINTLIVRTHRIALLNKNYEHYKQHNFPEDGGIQPTSYEYYWPTGGNDDKGTKSITDSSQVTRMASISI